MTDNNLILPFGNTKLFVNETGRNKIYDYYLTETIDKAEDYIDFLQALRTMEEEDLMVIHVNCFGGSVYTGNQILTAMDSCQGTIVAELEGACYSMATYIFLNADDWVVHKGSSFMSHTSSLGFSAKECDFHAFAEHNRKDVIDRVNTFYRNFHTEEEITKILNNVDVYLFPDQVEERLVGYREARQADIKMMMEAQGITEQPSLDSIIQEAVEKGLQKILETHTLTPKPEAKKTKVNKDLSGYQPVVAVAPDKAKPPTKR